MRKSYSHPTKTQNLSYLSCGFGHFSELKSLPFSPSQQTRNASVASLATSGSTIWTSGRNRDDWAPWLSTINSIFLFKLCKDLLLFLIQLSLNVDLEWLSFKLLSRSDLHSGSMPVALEVTKSSTTDLRGERLNLLTSFKCFQKAFVCRSQLSRFQILKTLGHVTVPFFSMYTMWSKVEHTISHDCSNSPLIVNAYFTNCPTRLQKYAWFGSQRKWLWNQNLKRQPNPFSPVLFRNDPSPASDFCAFPAKPLKRAA